jgi:hypothetical protein
MSNAFTRDVVFAAQIGFTASNLPSLTLHVVTNVNGQLRTAYPI